MTKNDHPFTCISTVWHVLITIFSITLCGQTTAIMGSGENKWQKVDEGSSSCPLVISESAVPQIPQHGGGRQCKLALSYLPQLCRIWSGTWWLCQPHDVHCGGKSTLQQMDICSNSSPSLEQKKIGGDVMI